MAVYFASDHHFNHARILEFTRPTRPFNTIEEMNEKLISRHNEVVKPEDDVWFLGDFGLGKMSETLGIVQRLNGNKRLILGNHDKPHVSYHAGKFEKEHKWMLMYLAAGFEDVMHSAVIPFKGSVAMLSHFPPVGDSGPEDRYKEFRPAPPGRATYLIHGHIHSKNMADPRYKNQIHVGVDATGYAPVNQKTLEALVDHWRDSVWI